MAATTTVEPQPSPREAEDRRRAVATFAASVAAVAIVVACYWVLMLNPEAGGLSHRRITHLLQFAGSSSRLGDRLSGVTVDEARLAVAASAVFAVVWGLAGYLLLTTSWQGAWKTGFGRRTEGRTLALPLAVGGAAVALVEKALTLIAVTDDGGGVGYADWLWSILPKMIVTLAWVKWLLAGTLILVVVAMTVSAATAFARTTLPKANDDLKPTDPASKPTAGAPPPA
ncbi:MAG: hypothetical protein AAF547_18080, partial [Actinomycetota bacterium]